MQNIKFDIETFEPEPGRVNVLGILNWTDAALLGAAGIETAIISPIGAGLHAPEEWVELDHPRSDKNTDPHSNRFL
jgi:acetylornithine deacetylase/succinyl-diaminopimelate desuccinylase-like protein